MKFLFYLLPISMLTTFIAIKMHKSFVILERSRESPIDGQELRGSQWNIAYPRNILAF